MMCSNNEEGIQLHHEMGVRTDNLKPRHTYVPWVTFNHVRFRDITGGMICCHTLILYYSSTATQIRNQIETNFYF